MEMTLSGARMQLSTMRKPAVQRRQRDERGLGSLWSAGAPQDSCIVFLGASAAGPAHSSPGRGDTSVAQNATAAHVRHEHRDDAHEVQLAEQCFENFFFFQAEDGI